MTKKNKRSIAAENQDAVEKSHDERMAAFKKSLTPADRKRMENLGRDIFRGVIDYATASGDLDPTPKNILAFSRALIKRIHEGEMKWGIATDFRPNLLRLARSAKSDENWELSCLYYGTWLEHQMNSLLHFWLKRKGVDDHYAEILMKESGVRGKMLWLCLCVAGRPVPAKQLNRLIALAERRNQFVHYKWRMHNPDAEDSHFQRAAEGAESLVQFFYRFERKHFYQNRKGLLRNPSHV
jgi:hypothetical protein